MATTQPTVQHVMDHWAAVAAHEAEHDAATDAHIAAHTAERDKRAADAANAARVNDDT